MAIEPLDALRLAWWFRGLSNIELQYAQRTCTIPTHSSYPVMNLSHALAVVCYELFMTASQGLAESRERSSRQELGCSCFPEECGHLLESGRGHPRRV